MSFFNEVNEDALTIAPEAAATGPRVGFLESFAVGYEQQVRTAAMYGIEKAWFEAEAAQVEQLRKAGVEDVPHLADGAFGFLGAGSFSGDYMEAARFYEDGGDPEIAQRLDQYDAKIKEYQKRFPALSLRTSREMWDNVRATAQEYEQRGNNDRRTFGGTLGVFAGGMIGAVNPEADPLNFATLGVGGIGRSVLTRIAGQGGAQGVVEGVNQITGVQEQRRLLGLDYGPGDALMRIGGAALGGAVLQGVGEGVVAGARRWFRSSAADVAPPPPPELIQRPPLPDTTRLPAQTVPADEALAAARLTQAPDTYIDHLHEASPLSVGRAGRARTVLDLDYVAARLEEWGGEAPAALRPKTDTALTLPRSDFVAPDLSRAVERTQLDDIARKTDPDTFRRYDALAQRRDTFRRWIEELADTRDASLQTRIDEIDDKIAALAVKAEDTGGKRAAKLRKDIAALEAEKAGMIDDAMTNGRETPDMARVRRQLMREDEKMRELAPLVSRAYARAQQKWTNTAADRQAIADMMRANRTTLPVDAQAARVASALPEALDTLVDRAPILQQRHKLPEGAVKQDADAADIAAAIVAENAKVLDEATEAYKAQVDTLLEGIDGEPVIRVGDRQMHLDKDTVFVPNEDGTGGRELTIRQLLEEDKMHDHELEAVTTCSLRKTS